MFAEPEFRHLLVLEVGRCTRYQDFVCLCLLRFDHPPSPPDWLRNAVSLKLAELFRSTDIVGTIGDEAAALLLHISDADAGGIIERVRQRAEGCAFLPPTGGPGVKVRVQTSAVSFPGDATTAPSLLERAQARFRPLS